MSILFEDIDMEIHGACPVAEMENQDLFNVPKSRCLAGRWPGTHFPTSVGG